MRDCDRDWGDQNGGWRERKTDREICVPPHDKQKSKEPCTDPERFRTEDMLARVLNKI